MNPNLVILAGGISSRMRKPGVLVNNLDPTLMRQAQQSSKSIIGIGEQQRPFLDYLLYNAHEAGYRDVVMVVGEHHEEVRTLYGEQDSGNKFHGISISYAVQNIPQGRIKPLGTADALLRALLTRPDWKGTTFTVCNSDNLYSRQALRALLVTSHPCAMIDYDRDALQFEQSKIEQFAVIQKDENGFLTQIIEKPKPGELATAKDAGGRIGISMNIFRFSYDVILPILQRVPLHPVRLEKELPRAVMMLVKSNPGAMMTIPFSEHVPDLTCQDDIGLVQEFLRKEFPGFRWGLM